MHQNSYEACTHRSTSFPRLEYSNQEVLLHCNAEAWKFLAHVLNLDKTTWLNYQPAPVWFGSYIILRFHLIKCDLVRTSKKLGKIWFWIYYYYFFRLLFSCHLWTCIQLHTLQSKSHDPS